MDRRKFIAGAGIALTTTIAGCSSEGSNNNDGNAAKKATDTTTSSSDSSSESKDTTTTTTTSSQGAELKLAFGETAKLDNGVTATVESIELKDSFETDGFENEPKEGKQFAFVKVTAKNTGDKPQWLPIPMDMSAIVNGDQISSYMYTGGDAYQISGSKSQPGISEEGYVVYEVPADASKDDIKIQWYKEGFSESGKYTINVQWSAE